MSANQKTMFDEPLPAYLQTGGSSPVEGRRLASGEQRKKRGMKAAAAAKAPELAHARLVARIIAENRGTVTADDVAAALEKSQRPKLGNAAGSLFVGDEWEWTGEYRKSTRPSQHAHVRKVWRLKGTHASND